MNALTNNTATLFRRYLWLLDVIYSAGRITLDEIRVRWQRNEMSGGEELPRKTFENHRKAVEELFDVNIACDRRTNEYYVECGDDLVRDDLRRWLLETFAVNDLLVNSKRLRRRDRLQRDLFGLRLSNCGTPGDGGEPMLGDRLPPYLR